MPHRLSARAPLRTSLRLAAGALALALAFSVSARAQDDEGDDDDGDAAAPIVVDISGPCVLTVKGETLPCRGVAYMVFPSNHRIDFTAITETDGWSFSGDHDQGAGGDYALTLDSVLDPASGRLEADGRCEMEVGKDRRTVMSLDCRAFTKDGEVTLDASGTIAVDAPDDDDDGPDDGDDMVA